MYRADNSVATNFGVAAYLTVYLYLGIERLNCISIPYIPLLTQIVIKVGLSLRDGKTHQKFHIQYLLHLSFVVLCVCLSIKCSLN